MNNLWTAAVECLYFVDIARDQFSMAAKQRL